MAANPRAAAVAALVRQEQDGFSNLVLDAELRRQKLEGRDKAFAGAIFYTVLEHQGTLDFILEQFLPKGLARLDPQVREILRAALAQARYMQVPVSAAVNEAVKLTRTFKRRVRPGWSMPSCARPAIMIWKLPASGMRPSASWCWALRGRMWQSFCAPITPRKRWAS